MSERTRGQESRGTNQESIGREQQQQGSQQEQNVSGSRDQNPQRGSSWENYRTREMGGGQQQRQEGMEGRSEELNGSNEGNLEQNDMD